MKIKILLIAAVFSFFGAVSVFSQEKVVPKISDIRAQLFFEETGALSDDLFSRPELSLFNTIIGEGSAGGASSSTLVTVEVSGRNVKVGSVKVEVIATGDKNKLLGKTLISLALYDSKTKFYAPLWIYDTGCEKVKISARLIGRGIKPSLTKATIPFLCGE